MRDKYLSIKEKTSPLSDRSSLELNPLDLGCPTIDEVIDPFQDGRRELELRMLLMESIYLVNNSITTYSTSNVWLVNTHSNMTSRA